MYVYKSWDDNFDSSCFIICCGHWSDHITKTRLFKYIENFTTKKYENFQIKILIFFIFLLKT